MDSPNVVGSWYHLYGVWGTGSDNVYAVGNSGTILHYDGEAWNVDADLATYVNLRDIWGSSADDIWVVGDGGRAIHSDGNTWESVDTGVREDLTAVWGSSPDNVFAVGEETIIHFDGQSWSEVTAPAADHPRHYQDVWGSSGSDVYAVENHEEISHFDGNVWSNFTIPGLESASYVTGSGESDVYIAARYFNVYRFDGNSWTSIRQGSFFRDHWRGVWASAEAEFWGVGHELIKYDGMTWQDVTVYRPALSAVWVSTGNEVIAGNNAGSLIRYDGASWTEHEYAIHDFVVGFWGTSSDDLYALEYYNSVNHFDGNAWTEVQVWPGDGYVNDIWGSATDDIFVVGEVYGEPPHVLHFDGSKWSAMPLPDIGWLRLEGVWGTANDNVYAVGGFGVVLHYDGVEWSMQDSLRTEELVDVWGRSGTDIYALGHQEIFHFDGAKWNMEVTGYPGILNEICGAGDLDVLAVGDIGTILHNDGTSWRELPRVTTSNLNGVHQYGANGAIVVGNGDLVLKCTIE